MKLPRAVVKLTDSFERLPGIGPKTAQRLVFHLLHFPEYEIERFAQALVDLKKGVTLCSNCKNISEGELCSVCLDTSRDSSSILVVTSPLDVLAFDKTNYSGLYHVLHGVIDPLNNIGPEDIFIQELLSRVENLLNGPENFAIEIILSNSTSMEGESTAMYLSKHLRALSGDTDRLKITRIARGIPVGGDIEYADNITLSRALEGRSNF